MLALEQGEPEGISKSTYLFVELEGRPVPFHCEEFRIHRGDLIVHLEAVDSAESATPLLQATVWAERKRVSTGPEAPGWDSLTGYEAFDHVHGSMGPILEVQEYPQQFLARCEIDGHEVLLPLNESTVVSIDEAQERVTFALPAGLLDVYLRDEDEPDEPEA